MIIKVHVNTHAHEERMEEIDIDEYKIWTTAIPSQGEANEAVIEIIADYFNTSISNVKIKSGIHGKHKFIEIKQ